MKSTIGQVLLWAGFLSGALATVFATATWARLDLTVKDQSFVTIGELSEDEKKEAAKNGDAAVLPQLSLPLNARLIQAGDNPVSSMADLKTDVQFPLTVTYREASGTETISWRGSNKELKVEVSDRKNLLELFGNQSKPTQRTELAIDKISEDSSGWKAGLRPGTVINGMNNERNLEPGTVVGNSIGPPLTEEVDKIKELNANDFNKKLGGLTGNSVDLEYQLDDGSQKSAMVNVGSPWGTINWLWYALSALTCIVGVVLLNISRKESVGQSDKTQANLQQIKGHLDSLVSKTETLNNEIKDYKPRQTLTFIEDELADDFRDFADGRDSISAEHGLETFAQVMTQFAAGERSINRAWSASADGYVEEAATCVERGLAMLKTAKKMLDAA